MDIIQQKVSPGDAGEPVVVEFVGEDGNAVTVSMNNYGKPRPTNNEAISDAKAMMADVASSSTENTAGAAGQIPSPVRQAPTSRGNSPID